MVRILSGALGLLAALKGFQILHAQHDPPPGRLYLPSSVRAVGPRAMKNRLSALFWSFCRRDMPTVPSVKGVAENSAARVVPEPPPPAPPGV